MTAFCEFKFIFFVGHTQTLLLLHLFSIMIQYPYMIAHSNFALDLIDKNLFAVKYARQNTPAGTLGM